MKYFYKQGNAQLGPFSIDRLVEIIDMDTFIWYDNLEDWKMAKEIDEIRILLNSKKISENFNSQKQSVRQKLFQSPFSFKGRIRRLEYGISLIIFCVLYLLGFVIFLDTSVGRLHSAFNILFFALAYFILAQGAKRSHDIGNSSWVLLIPFYLVYLIFANGDIGGNLYGSDPKK